MAVSAKIKSEIWTRAGGRCSMCQRDLIDASVGLDQSTMMRGGPYCCREN
jgi:hypothetical protein